MKEILIVVACVVAACGIAWLVSGADEWLRPEYRARVAANRQMNAEYVKSLPTPYSLPLVNGAGDADAQQITGSP